jgi:hypothetical protein
LNHASQQRPIHRSTIYDTEQKIVYDEAGATQTAPHVRAFPRHQHQDWQHYWVKLHVVVAIDVVERQPGSVKSLELSANFGLQLRPQRR